MTLSSLKLVLSQARPGDWLYQAGDEFKITQGFWDKFWLCVDDVLSRFTTTDRVQKAVRCILDKEIKSLKDQGPKPSHPRYFQLAHEVEQFQNIVNDLNKCRLVWHQQFTSLPQLQSQDLSSFDAQLNGIQEIYSILPQQQQLEYRDSLTETENALKQYNRPKAFDSEKISAWLTLARVLEKCKRAWLTELNLKADSLDCCEWNYRLGKWSIKPHRQILIVANGASKSLFYLKISFDSKKMFEEWAQRCSANPPGFEAQEKATIKLLVDQLFRFIQGQVEHQRRPITLEFPGWADILEPDAIKLVANRFQKFMDSLVKATQVLMTENPTYFIHEAALLEQLSLQQNKDINVNVCLSHLAYTGRDPFIRPPVLRPELIPLVSQLEVSSNRKITLPTNVLKLQTLEKILMNFTESHDFILRLNGKDRGCCKAVLLEAFPYLQTRENLQGLQGADPNCLNLDTLTKSSPVHPNFTEWVINSILVFVYSRQHPDLHRGTTQAEHAFTTYYALLHFLRPNSVAIDIET